MIGIAIEGNRFGTKIGIIRSIKTTENNTLRVGVEIISRNAFSVSAQQTMNDNTQEEGNESIDALIDQHRFEGQSDAFNCLFLPKEFSYTKAQTLILPKHRYVANGQYEMKISKEIKLIQTKAMLAQHDNWVRVYFEEMQAN
jgi:imidazole glycerol phosphate synthase subunit HisF